MTSGPILVTGAAGLIGGRLVSRLAAEGVAVIATDRRTAESLPGVRWVTIDLMDGAALTALMREVQVSAVVHAGAISGPMIAAGDPHQVMSVNVGGALNIAEASLRAGVMRESLCAPSSSICKHWKRVRVDNATRATFTGHRRFHRLRGQVVGPYLMRSAGNNLRGMKDARFDQAPNRMVCDA
jgi:UDP-glucose 4-epimerase